MAEELSYSSSRPDNKRKFDDPSAAAAPPTRRPTGFSAPISSPPPPPPPESGSGAAATPSYNSVPPPPDGIQLAKQRAQEIAARLFSDAEAKRPKLENGGGATEGSDHLQKPTLPSQLASPAYPTYGYQGSSKKIDIPNGKVGVIIGKGGETIRYLQLQSGAKIQVTRDMDADPNAQTRAVEISGTSEQISKAEQLINDVLAEADSGGSGIISARLFGGPQTGAEQFQMKIPNSKVGLIIGKGGESIKSMQAKSGARIQVIPLHLPPGDTSTERTVYIDGTKEQIEAGKQLVNEIVNSENRVRNPTMTGGYSSQGYRPPRPPTTWGPPGAPPMQQPGYGYMQPGAYPGPPPQYNMPQQQYQSYPSPASGGFQSSWDQSNPSNPPAQQSAPGTGYDYYNQQQTQQPSGGPSAPADNTGYNYGQPYNSQYSYGDSTYSQSTVGQQGYGQDSYSQQGYPPAPQQGYSQPVSAPQTGYDHQQGYGTTPGYGAAANPNQEGSSAQQAPLSTTVSYPTQGTPSGYGLPQTSQPGYGGQPPAQAGYPNYGQPPPQGQKPPPPTSAYGQGPPPVPTQSSYGTYPPSGYGQQQAYGGAGTTSQPAYGQQPQAYTDPHGSGGYSSQPPPAYSSDSTGQGAVYDQSTAATAAAPPSAASTGATKASPS
ncbi:far upstream element-binding protein 2 [Ananas comosus]|uniref:Far upstream element-binding protein 2 n=1 Tax=Ananas comosus TaxID=4615 RepID=A0A6P5FNH5_ANACO|nr:far upstream element-binding protein 2 [Ananas comosus]